MPNFANNPDRASWLHVYICDNDCVILRGYCENKAVRIGFGEVVTKLLPAH